jgi:hypothetical protein
MEPDVTRRLQYAAAIACGVFAALAVHILFKVLGLGLDSVLRDLIPSNKQQVVSSLAWWAIGVAGFAAGWASGAYLIAAAREREFLYRLAYRLLIAVVLAVSTVAGLMSKSGSGGGISDQGRRLLKRARAGQAVTARFPTAAKNHAAPGRCILLKT